MENMLSRLSNAATSLGKRKKSDSEGGEMKKIRRETHAKSKSSKALLHGEEQRGGLVILRSTHVSKPLSSHQPKQPQRHTSAQPGAQPTEEQAEEDVRHMEAELFQLRDRSRTYSQSFSSTGVDGSLPSTSNHKPLSLSNHQSNTETYHTIPLQETPINQKNKKLRSDRSRRSSHGKRLSSSLGNTGVITQPHPSISPAAFHKHLDPNLPDAMRLCHLLVWCANRNSPTNNASSSDLPSLSGPQLEKLKAVQHEFIKSLASGKVETAVGSSAQEKADTGVRLEEHEQNTKNKQREATFLLDINRAKDEEAAWVELIHSYNTRQSSTLANLESTLSASTSGDRGYEKWSPREQELSERFIEGVNLSRSYIDEHDARVRSKTSSPISNRINGMQFQVDQLHQSLHVSSQLAARTERDLDSRFRQLSSLLEFHRKAPSTSVEPRQVDPRELLQTIAQTDTSRAQEMGEVARMTAREVTRLDRSGIQPFSSQDRVIALPSTPRTPRRAATPNNRADR